MKRNDTRPTRTLSASEELKVFAGVVAQPFVAAGVAFLAFPMFLLDASGRTLAGGFPTDVTQAARSVAIGAGILAFFLTVFGALPTALWLMKRKQVSLGEALIYGLGFGNVPMLVGTLFAGAHGPEGFVRGVGFSSLLGMAGAAVFWLIALRGHKSSISPI